MSATSWPLELETMPGCDRAMERVEAWFHQAVLDRPPLRFSRHNVQYESAKALDTARWPTLKDRWFDAEYQVDAFLADLATTRLRAETFPVFWPNLGPEIYAAFFGIDLTYGEITSWAKPGIHEQTREADIARLRFDPQNLYFRKLEEMTRVALQKAPGQFLVGVTSWGPGIDCVAAWREPQELCIDLLENPESVKELLERSVAPFRSIYDRFHGLLTQHRQPSVSWMCVPAFGRNHIVQTDFANLISPAQFDEFCLPYLRQEIAGLDHVIFHMDGIRVARHLDRILEIPEIQAIQWVQGVGTDEPILQWIPLIRRIQEAGKSVVVDLKLAELEPFMEQLRPEGLFLFLPVGDDEQEAVMRRVEKW
jgi:hypothetical protein